MQCMSFRTGWDRFPRRNLSPPRHALNMQSARATNTSPNGLRKNGVDTSLRRRQMPPCAYFTGSCHRGSCAPINGSLQTLRTMLLARQISENKRPDAQYIGKTRGKGRISTRGPPWGVQGLFGMSIWPAFFCLPPSPQPPPQSSCAAGRPLTSLSR